MFSAVNQDLYRSVQNNTCSKINVLTTWNNTSSMTKISLKNTVKKSGQNETNFGGLKGFCIERGLVSPAVTLRATYQAVSKLLLIWWLFDSYHMVHIIYIDHIPYWPYYMVQHITDLPLIRSTSEWAFKKPADPIVYPQWKVIFEGVKNKLTR